MAGFGARPQIAGMVVPTVDLAQLVAPPADERLALVQALWDSLRADAHAVLLTADEGGRGAGRAAPTAAIKSFLEENHPYDSSRTSVSEV